MGAIVTVGNTLRAEGRTMGRILLWTTAGVVMTMAGTAAAQAADPRTPPASQQSRDPLQLKESRYQIGQIERILEGAVEHGATVIRDRLQAIMPTDMLLTENARARGFRLDGYGVFFDVEVPTLEGTLPWSFRTLDQNDLGIDNALRTLRSFVDAAAANDVNLQQALKRIELQVTPAGGLLPTAVPVQASSNTAAGAASGGSAPPAPDLVLSNPNEAYRTAIRAALIDAMLEHTRGLGIGPNEWLTVAARSSDDRPRLAPADPEGQTNVLSIRGADLAAFLAGQITRDEALKRVDVRVF
jgi:hypothetical protein